LLGGLQNGGNFPHVGSFLKMAVFNEFDADGMLHRTAAY
jgi:hypothetical protein